MSQLSVAQGKIATLRNLLEKSKGEIAKALPRHLTPERMARVAITAVQKTPELLDCDPVSIVGAVMQASQLGLDLDGILGQAYLVPYKNRKANRTDAQLIVGYKGFLALARRSGQVSVFAAHIAYENDVFQFTLGTKPEIVHKPHFGERGKPVAAYAVLIYGDGGADCEVISWPEVLEFQQRYAKRGRDGTLFGPWIDHLIEMAKKTAIRRIAKRAPLSVELTRAAALDDLAENELPQDLGAELGLSRTDEVSARLAALAAEPEADPPAEAAGKEE